MAREKPNIDYAAELSRTPEFATPEIARACAFRPRALLVALHDAGVVSWADAAKRFGVSAPRLKELIRGQAAITGEEGQKLLEACKGISGRG